MPPYGPAFDGPTAEMVAGQLLLASQPGFPGELYFWVSESSSSNAEVDYLLAGGGEPVPIEVKSGASGSLKSLHQFLRRADLELGVRLHPGPLTDEQLRVNMPGKPLDYRLVSVPIYLAELVSEWLRQ